MHNVWTIAKREYNLYFSSPVAYVVSFIIFLILGVFFYYTLLIATSALAMQQSFVPSIDVILWWLGYDLITSARNSQLNLTGGQGRVLHPFWAGIVMSLANPYWLIWWATLGLGYVLFAYKYGLLGVIFFFIGHFLADLGWYSLVSMAVAQGKRFISDRVYHGFMIACALFLMVFGCYFGYQGVRTLLGA